MGGQRAASVARRILVDWRNEESLNGLMTDVWRCGRRTRLQLGARVPDGRTNRIIGSGVERVSVRRRLVKHFLEDVLKFSTSCFTGRPSAQFVRFERRRFESGQSKTEAQQDSTMN